MVKLVCDDPTNHPWYGECDDLLNGECSECMALREGLWSIQHIMWEEDTKFR